MLRSIAALSLAARCSGIYDADKRLEVARVYGNIQAYGYYFIDLEVGSPRQRVSVIIDTGSSIAAFPCAGCEHCGKHADPAFDYARSSSARWMRCGPSCSGSCTEGLCGYMQGYSEGSSVTGVYFSDIVQLGDSPQNPAVRSHLGCHVAETNLFYNQKANGILGMGPQRTLLQDLFADKARLDSSVFSLCLAEWGGALTLGGRNGSYHTAPMRYVPLEMTRGVYGVALNAIVVEGRNVSSRAGRAMVDSGTTYTYLASGNYRALRDAVEGHCTRHGCGGARRNADGVCWYLPGGAAGLRHFPKVELAFGSVVAEWVPRGYMYKKELDHTWCYSFQDDGAYAETTLGATWMLHNEVVFDLRAGRLGIAPAACPEHRRRPPSPVASADFATQFAMEGLGTVSAPGGVMLLPLALLLALLPGRRLLARFGESRPHHMPLAEEPEAGAEAMLPPSGGPEQPV